MLTPKDAYDAFVKKFPETKRTKISDWGGFYTCSPAPLDDMTDEFYQIDKETGKITFWDYAEYAEYVRKLPEDYYPESIEID